MAVDVVGGIGDQLDPACRVVLVNAVHQAEKALLNQVFQRDVRRKKLPGLLLDQGAELQHQRFAGRGRAWPAGLIFSEKPTRARLVIQPAWPAPLRPIPAAGRTGGAYCLCHA